MDSKASQPASAVNQNMSPLTPNGYWIYPTAEKRPHSTAVDIDFGHWMDYKRIKAYRPCTTYQDKKMFSNRHN